MADFNDIFDPRVINGVIEKFTNPDELLGLSLIGREAHPWPTFTYDIVVASRDRATITAPGSAAKIVARQKRGIMTGSFAYTREKKIFDRRTLEWFRMPGEIARSNGERAVAMELRDLDVRYRKLDESFFWMMLSGVLTYSHEGTFVSIDYQIAATHKPTASVYWNDPNSDPQANIRAWRQLMVRDAQVTPDRVYLNYNTMSVMLEHPKIKEMLSDEQKRNYVAEHTLRRFAGLDWIEYDGGYVSGDPETGTYTSYIPDGYIIIVSTANRPWVMLEGPSADDEAPPHHTGRFAKSWKEHDPSNRQYLLEDTRIPALLRPEQVIYARVY